MASPASIAASVGEGARLGRLGGRGESSCGGEMGAAREAGGVVSQRGCSPGGLSGEAVDASLCMACWDGVRVLDVKGWCTEVSAMTS